MTTPVNSATVTEDELRAILRDEYGIDAGEDDDFDDLLEMLQAQDHPIDVNVPTPIEDMPDDEGADDEPEQAPAKPLTAKQKAAEAAKAAAAKAPVKTDKAPPAAPAKKRVPTHYTIIISESEIDNAPAKGAVNGAAFSIVRGVEVKITAGQYECFKNAKRDSFRQVKNADGTRELKPTVVPAYPVSVIETHYE
jgi:hypothetical protein